MIDWQEPPAVVAPLPQQFDLICTQTAVAGRPLTPQYRFRIDLVQNRWCEGACEAPQQIASVTPDRYVLVENEHRSRTLRTSNYSWINRLNGAHWEQSQAVGRLTQVSSRQGRCERAPYSGMPTPLL